jgi:hypothetical protein
MTVEDLETAVAQLSPEQFARFSVWFAEYQAELWDRQLEADQRSGRLTKVLDRVRDDIAAGRSKPL